MANTYSSLFTSDGSAPVSGRPRRSAERPVIDAVEKTLAATELQDDDRVVLMPIFPGARIAFLRFEADDLDSDGSPALVGKLVASNGDSGDDVDLVTGITLGSGATVTEAIPLLSAPELDGTRDFATIDFVPTTSAATGAEGDVKLFVVLD